MQYIFGAGSPAGIPFGGPLLLVLVIWSLFWKGLALWHAGQRGQAWWFVVLLIVNTAGVLEIIYLFAFLKLGFSRLFTKLTSSS